MSLPDYLLDEPDNQCENCHAQSMRGRRLCEECAADLEDMYADEKISEGKVRR